jgi:molybdopterin/thiamine biosynthesis adenylyltransferase
VDDEASASLREIDAALRQRSFTRDWEHPRPRYVGQLDRTGLRIPVSVEIADHEFVQPPLIRLLRSAADACRPLPHVAGPEGLLCYLDSRATVLDRYEPGGTVLLCLDQAERVLRDALRGRSDHDFAGEFMGYWADDYVLVDLPSGFAGEGAIHWVALREDPKDPVPILARKKRLAASFLKAHRLGTGKDLSPAAEVCRIVSLSTNLTLDPNAHWPPADLAALNAWIDRFGPKASSCLEDVFRLGEGVRRWIAVRAPNGCCLAHIEIPPALNRPEFLVNRKQFLFANLLKQGANVKVLRFRGLSMDETYLYSRNLGGWKSLAGKEIALVGCGTIGGFLAKHLAQCGAGSCGGRLLLIDNDILQPGNLGRHLLGMRDLKRNKAEACRDAILRDLPHLDIDAHPDNALKALGPLSRSDLVIDATGEEALSIALNHHAVRRRPSFPPVLYVWLAGNGSAVQALLCDRSEHACYKCMKPELAGQSRYRAVRSDRDLRLDTNAPCGDGLFVPFPVSRSAAAAALAVELALAWAGGKPEPRFRNRLLDPAHAFNVKDGNPAPSAACPACRSAAA